MKHFGIAVLLFSVVACGDSGGSGTTGSGGGGEGGSGSTTSTSTTSVGGGGTGGGGAQTKCDEVCDKNQEVEDALTCGWTKSATCVADCETYFAGVAATCVDEAEAYEDCRIAQPALDFECSPNDPDGSSTLSSTACDDEYAALTGC